MFEGWITEEEIAAEDLVHKTIAFMALRHYHHISIP
jgi:hypothetical protein